MKKTYLFIAFFTLVTLASNVIYAQQKQENIKQILALSQEEDKIKKIIDENVNSIKQQLVQNQESIGGMETVNIIMDIIIKETNNLITEEELIALYDEDFSEKNIKNILKFYKTPSGELYAQKVMPIELENMINDRFTNVLNNLDNLIIESQLSSDDMEDQR